MIKKNVSAKARRRPRKPKRAASNRETINATITALDRIKPTNPKIAGLIALFKSWLRDESGYDEETWPKLKKTLDQERARVGARSLF